MQMPPVSVCHHVSMIGQRPPPTTSKYQRHGLGLMASPTTPSTRRDVRELCRTHCSKGEHRVHCSTAQYSTVQYITVQ